MFLEFFYNLRAHKVPVTTHNWLAFMRALVDGLHGDSLDGFYQVARCVLVSDESHYDAFDQAFGESFRGVARDLSGLLEDLDDWLRDPKQLLHLDPALAALLKTMDIDTLRQQLLERLAEQKKRHEGGSRWVGTGGTSPFGQGGQHPSGIRVGGTGGGRSALAVADARRFRAYRRDLVLDTRQIAAALRKLRTMGRKGVDDELDIDATVDATARNCGDLEIEMRPPRKNDVRVLLLMDVGGSMDPFSMLVSGLFSAATASGGFRELRSYYFHNCVYDRVYEDAAFSKPVGTPELLRQLDRHWRLVVVGDAYMHPGELMMSSGNWYDGTRGPVGLTWLARLADRFPRSAWLNPEDPEIWDAPTVAEIRRVFSMFPLTLAGLDAMVKHLRNPPGATRSARIHALARAS
ncbi:MAG: VWA domain-containing protein [Nannocystaceae bacterium]|nr:VWA domain-containing protein [Nannocystaceae bacterium]